MFDTNEVDQIYNNSANPNHNGYHNFPENLYNQ